MGEDRQAVRAHQLHDSVGILAADNDQLNRADALLEISRHTQPRGRDFNLDVGIPP